MKRYLTYIIGALFLVLTTSFAYNQLAEDDWGFFGHRLINRMAVFTLPPELISVFKGHIEYLSEHSVDPDKRRYANSFEAVRHFIDIDVWGEPPFDNLPREWNEALAKFTTLQAVAPGDTVEFFNFPIEEEFYVDSVTFHLPGGSTVNVEKWTYVNAF